MNSSAFQALIEQLVDLTPVQRGALAEPLGNEGSTDEAIALIEARFEVAPACGHCKSERFGRWGHASGMRRYKCHDCKRTFNALTGTLLAYLRRREAWLAYARTLVDRVSLRKAAKRTGICLDTSFRWRHRILEIGKNKRPPLLTGIVLCASTTRRRSGRDLHSEIGERLKDVSWPRASEAWWQGKKAGSID